MYIGLYLKNDDLDVEKRSLMFFKVEVVCGLSQVVCYKGRVISVLVEVLYIIIVN